MKRIPLIAAVFCWVFTLPFVLYLAATSRE